MEDANLGLGAEVPVNLPNHAKVVPDHHRDVMTGQVPERISAMVSQVIQHDIEARKEQ